MPGDIERFLSHVELFQHVSSGTRQAFAAASTCLEVAPGQLLFEEGQAGEFLFIVETGALEAFQRNPAGGSVLLRTLGRGDVGGLTSIVLQKPRSATLRARQATQLVTVPASEVRRLLAEHSDLSHSLIAALSAKLRIKTRAIAAQKSVARDTRFRIAFFDIKQYDRKSLEPLLGNDLAATWLAPRLDARTVELAAGHQAVCCFVNDELSRAVLDSLAGLGVGLVALRCAGYNNVDLEAATEFGIELVRVPAYSPHAVAEHTLALIMALNRKTHRAYNRVREGNFSLSGLVGNDLYGQTVGIVGLGKIGRCCARIFRGLGMTVLAQDVAPDTEFVQANGVEVVKIEELLQRSDIVTLHSPLLPATRHLINAERLSRMKHGAMLINTSRGALVDTRALIHALKSGTLGAAGLDVYEEEGEYFFEDRSADVIDDDVLARLMTFNNVLITSHQAFLTHQALKNIADTTLASIRQYTHGEALEHRVVARS